MFSLLSSEGLYARLPAKDNLVRILHPQGVSASSRPPSVRYTASLNVSLSASAEYLKALLEDDGDIELDADLLAILEGLPAVAAAREKGGRKYRWPNLYCLFWNFFLQRSTEMDFILKAIPFKI